MHAWYNIINRTASQPEWYICIRNLSAHRLPNIQVLPSKKQNPSKSFVLLGNMVWVTAPPNLALRYRSSKSNHVPFAKPLHICSANLRGSASACLSTPKQKEPFGSFLLWCGCSKRICQSNLRYGLKYSIASAVDTFILLSIDKNALGRL